MLAGNFGIKKMLLPLILALSTLFALAPTAMAGQSATTGLQVCQLVASTPSIDYSNAKYMTAAAGRSCPTGVAWVYGALKRDLPGNTDQVLGKPYRISPAYGNTIGYFSSWATSGHRYFSFAASSTGASKMSTIVTAR